MMTIKAKELAQQLGVSAATLSLVLNRKPGISDKTREKIIKELQNLGYGYLIKNPQSEAQLQKTIGFVIYKNDGKMLGLNSFYPLILDGVESTARKYGYNLVIINLERADIENQIRYITDANCVGYVIFATEMKNNEIDYFENLGLPFVLLDNYYNDRRINTVKVNNEQCCYLAVKHLVEMGHQRIGYLSSGLSINSFLERRKFSMEALISFGITDMDKYTYNIGYPIDQSAEGILPILKKYKKSQLPTAFLADNDLVAIGAMQGMKHFGYQLPDDFSFIGNADRPISSLIEPRLTTIRVPQERFGAEAIFQLIQQLQNQESSFTRVEINGELVVRESVKNINQ
ncbi:MAG: LacI family DNA-binding transcriptional regulator [Lachnoclostridium edouardi]|uniref:LacI family DNA-binding transcriptional regulator n=1 Tax=Lachnoclostridium edouardi TaxID=1926283 RepID=UPI0026DBDB33|nr:LacI family DNA-binding transcriptional regulator [Lachnoclostridium edouardi]MDO4279911.1 LacI family DNA-binding transcriptional regulator [Lachnoclostridium edouardi]